MSSLNAWGCAVVMLLAASELVNGQAGRGSVRVGRSPDVSADRRIMFRLAAPNAQDVTVDGELDGASHPMAKGPDGVWTVTVGPLARTSTPTRSTLTA